jgi:hypothetical protein
MVERLTGASYMKWILFSGRLENDATADGRTLPAPPAKIEYMRPTYKPINAWVSSSNLKFARTIESERTVFDG